MSRRGLLPAALLAVGASAGCLLFTSLSGYSEGSAAVDAGAAEASVEDASGIITTGEDSSADAVGGDAVSAASLQLLQQASMTHINTGPSLTRTLSSPVTAGSLLVGVMLTHNPNAGAVFAVSDALTNAWRSTTYRRCDGSEIGTRIWYVEDSKAGTESVTVTQSPATGQLGLALFEYAGVAKSNALDVEQGQCAPLPTTTMSTPAVTTTSNDLVIGVFADPCGEGTMTIGAGWTLVDVDSTYFYLLEDQRGDGKGIPPGSQQPTATNPTNSNCWLGTVTAFKVRR